VLQTNLSGYYKSNSTESYYFDQIKIIKKEFAFIVEEIRTYFNFRAEFVIEN
jgi:hypothetical protein